MEGGTSKYTLHVTKLTTFQPTLSQPLDVKHKKSKNAYISKYKDELTVLHFKSKQTPGTDSHPYPISLLSIALDTTNQNILKCDMLHFHINNQAST
jgi:hypothetical protein